MKHVQLLNEIKAKGGLKIVTILLGTKHEVFYVDDELEEEFELLKWFKKGIAKQGSVVIRQVVNEDEYFISGVSLGGHKYTFLTAQQMGWAHTHDANSGEKIAKEEGVTFVHFNDLLEESDFDVFQEEFDDEECKVKNIKVDPKHSVFYKKEESGIVLNGSFAFNYGEELYNGTFCFLLHEEIDDESENDEIEFAPYLSTDIAFKEAFYDEIWDEDEQYEVFSAIDRFLETLQETNSDTMRALFDAYLKHYGVCHSEDPNS